MPEDWDIRKEDGSNHERFTNIYRGRRSIVSTLPLSNHGYRIMERTRHAPKMMRQTMNSFASKSEAIHAWEHEILYFFPWRPMPDNFPIPKRPKWK